MASGNAIAPVMAQGSAEIATPVEGDNNAAPPVVPAATETPGAPLAVETPQDAATATSTVPTSDDAATNDGDDLSAAVVPVPEFTISFQICGNDARDGTFDFLTSESIGAADTSVQCRSASDVYPGQFVTVTLQNEMYGPYVGTFGGNTTQVLENAVAPGSYTVTVGGSAGLVGTMPGVLMVSGTQTSLNVYYYIEVGADDGFGPNTNGTFQGVLQNCSNSERADTVDFYFDGFVAAENAEFCSQGLMAGQGTLTLNGTSWSDNPIGPIDIHVNSDGSFAVVGLSHGTYTVTESGSGMESGQFLISEQGYIVDARIVVYHDPLPATVEVAKAICIDGSRDGQVDYIVLRDDDVSTSATCNLVPTTDTFDVTLSNDASYAEDLTLVANGSSHVFPPAPAGTYRIQESGKDASTAFDVAPGEHVQILVINYILGPAPDQPDGTDPIVGFTGSYHYCESPDRAGEVDIMFFDFFASATGDCINEPMAPALFQVYRYDTADADAVATNTWTVTGEDNTFNLQGEPGLTEGYYRIGYQSDAFATPVLSDAYPVTGIGFIVVYVTIYTAPPNVATLTVHKEYCYDPARDGVTNFVVESDFGAAATEMCRNWTLGDDGDIEFTLTSIAAETGITVPLGNDGDASMAVFDNIAPGEYTLTESSARYNAVSPAFTVGLDAIGYTIRVENFTQDEFFFRSDDAVVLDLTAYNCFNQARGGEYDYYFVNEIYSQSLEECDSTIEYNFVLQKVVPGTGIAAAADLAFVPDPRVPNHYILGAVGDSVPEGTYRIQETTTGFTSEDVILVASINQVRFYVYQAADPTATATFTPTATATATATGTLTPTATATATTGPDATATSTQSNGWVIPKDGSTPTATTPPGDDGSGVTALPSTGQGSDSGSSGSLYLLLGLALSFLVGAAALTRKTRRA
jgi:hypothetical protein